MKSPFKFLDAYTKEDQHLFFGREEEIDELYQRVFKSNLLLVYGASGTGKTSLIQCGLATKFSDENWFSVYVRRQSNINDSLLKTIDTLSETKVTKEDLDPDESEILQRVEGLYLDHFKPIYLIFDQLEELFILGKEEEKNQFFQTIKTLNQSKLQCTIILIIREEYIATLSEMELEIPTLFDNRIRIEKMRKTKVKEVIEKSCGAIPSIQVEQEDEFLDGVIDNLSEDDLTVELTYLQVYLDKLYTKSKTIDGVHKFNPELLANTGKVQDVLAEFLEEQVQKLPNPDLGWKILKVFITKDGTKRSAKIKDIRKALSSQNFENTKEEIRTTVQQFIHFKILTEIEQSPNSFEFTHDSLAIKTFAKLDAKERNLIEITNLIGQQYQMYNSRGVLMSKENMSYVAPFLSDIVLSKSQLGFIDKSKKELNRKRRFWLAGTAMIIALLSVLTLFSFWKAREASVAQKEAVKEKQKAEQTLSDFRKEQKERKTLEVNELFEEAEAYVKAQELEENVKQVLEKIREVDSSPETLDRIEQFKKDNQL